MLLLKIIFIKILLLYIVVCGIAFIYRKLLQLLFSKTKPANSYKTIYNALLGVTYIPGEYKLFLKPGSLKVCSCIDAYLGTDISFYLISQITSVYRAWTSYWRHEIFNNLFNVVNCFYFVTSVSIKITMQLKNIKDTK